MDLRTDKTSYRDAHLKKEKRRVYVSERVKWGNKYSGEVFLDRSDPLCIRSRLFSHRNEDQRVHLSMTSVIWWNSIKNANQMYMPRKWWRSRYLSISSFFFFFKKKKKEFSSSYFDPNRGEDVVETESRSNSHKVRSLNSRQTSSVLGFPP